MAIHPHEIDMPYPFDTIGPDIFTGSTAHIFIPDQRGIKYKDRAITIKNGKAVLAGDNEAVKGSFQYFDSGKAVVRVASAGTRYKSSKRQSFNTGKKIVGDTRVIVPGGVAENGFVKASNIGSGYTDADVLKIANASGYITNGGVSNAANTDPIASVIVAHSMGS